MHVALLELVETGKPGLFANSAQSVGLHKTPIVGNGGRCGLKRHLPMTRLQTVARTVFLHHQGVSELAPAVANAKGSVIACEKKINEMLAFFAEGSQKCCQLLPVLFNRDFVQATDHGAVSGKLGGVAKFLDALCVNKVEIGQVGLLHVRILPVLLRRNADHSSKASIFVLVTTFSV